MLEVLTEEPLGPGGTLALSMTCLGVGAYASDCFVVVSRVVGGHAQSYGGSGAGVGGGIGIAGHVAQTGRHVAFSPPQEQQQSQQQQEATLADVSTVPVFRTPERVRGADDPRFGPYDVSVGELCNGDMARPLLWQVYDHRGDKAHKLVGGFTASLSEISEGATFELRRVSRRRGRLARIFRRRRPGRLGGDENADGRDPRGSLVGVMRFDTFRYERTATFLDYISAGCEIALSVAVDFTLSNGHPAMPRSLHHRDGHRDNEYLSAIRAVGTILAPYDTDQLIPAYGFGAVPAFSGPVTARAASAGGIGSA
jgi:hypothetical protein